MEFSLIVLDLQDARLAKRLRSNISRRARPGFGDVREIIVNLLENVELQEIPHPQGIRKFSC
ncbi:hypothetical protein FPOAC2_03543 [Fusarium poae]